MRRHILILCLLGNPYELVNGGHQRTIRELIEHFKCHESLTFTIITSSTKVSGIYFQKLYSNIDYYEIEIPMLWVEEQDNLYTNREYLQNQINQICSKFKTAISLLHTTYWISGMLGVTISKKYQIPQIHSPISSSYEKARNGFTPRSRYQREAENITLKNASLILSITKTEYTILCQEYKVNPSKILIIGRTVETCFLHPAHTASGNLDILTRTDWLNDKSKLHEYNDWWMQNAFCYIGRIVDYKGIKEIIQAWDMLYQKYQEKMPPLWIIGGNCINIASYRPNIIELVPNLPLYEANQKICWWGYVTSEGISNILLKCNVLIMHSGFEPGGRVVLEALAMGKPIIATPFGFSNDYIDDWYNGFQVTYRDVQHLASYMELFIKNPYLSNMLGINSKYVYQNLEQTWNYFSNMEEIYSAYSNNSFSKAYITTSILENDRKELLVDAFPYCDIKNSLVDISKEFLVCQTSLANMTTPYSYIWETDNLIIKQYFNRLNIEQLWNPCVQQKVICLSDLYEAAIYSTKFHTILPIYQKSDIYFSYSMPKARKLTSAECMRHMREVLDQFQAETASTLLSFGPFSNLNFETINKNIQSQHKYYTIHLMLSELFHVVEAYINLFESKERNDIFTILSLLSELSIQHKYALNYGKSLLEHIILWNSKLYLLPSSEIFWGETGFDAAQTYIEYYGESGIFKILLSNSLDSTIVLWICCLLTERYIRAKILMKKTDLNISVILTIIREWLS